MGNKVAINERRAKNFHWERVDGVFKTYAFVDRKFLESFKVVFEVQENGQAVAEVTNYTYPQLKMERTAYNGLNDAINAVNAFFEKMDELSHNIPYSARERAYKAYQKEIKRALEETQGETSD